MQTAGVVEGVLVGGGGVGYLTLAFNRRKINIKMNIKDL